MYTDVVVVGGTPSGNDDNLRLLEFLPGIQSITRNSLDRESSLRER